MFLVALDPDSPEDEASLRDRMTEAHRAEGKQCTPDLPTAAPRACLTVLPVAALYPRAAPLPVSAQRELTTPRGAYFHQN